jgi:NADPH-dependent glutamate synthase beta subunit-like oxidoreductase/ferredoxin
MKNEIMIKFTLDSKTISVPAGTVLIDAARQNGVEIPSMCYREGKKHFTSCMVCMVKDKPSGKLLPSCSVKVTEGMEIVSMDEEVKEARKTALELLLSEHVGDCEAPCQITCPAHMDIPLMNRHLAEGNFDEALKVVKKDIALPAVFGRICPAPCEGACRRKSVDESVSICLLKRYAGDEDLEKSTPWLPEKQKDRGKKIAIIGAGPAGLSAAHYLALRGYQCTVYDRKEKPGGTLWNEVDTGTLPADVLEKEIGLIAKLGVTFSSGINVDQKEYLIISAAYDALVIAVGSGESGAKEWGLEVDENRIKANKGSYQLGESKVFVAGSAMRHSKMAIRALGQGKEAAFSVDQFLSAKKVAGEPTIFNSRFGKLLPEEISAYLLESVEGNRIEPDDIKSGLSREQVMDEAARCMHCDCRELTDCKLRLLSDDYRANQKRFWSADRKLVEKQIQQDVVVYEPSKCIKCGICVHITAEYKEDYGLTFIGRGFDVVVGVPFNESIGNGLKKVALKVADACPTGAICRV